MDYNKYFMEKRVKNQDIMSMHGDEFTHPVFASLDHLLSGKPERR